MNIQPGINLRVYGILLSDDQKQVLLIDETVMDMRLIKFPGGGVEPFEGPGAALLREFREELAVDVQLGELFFVSPNFHVSFFRRQQLLSLYWRVQLTKGTPQPQIDRMHLLWRPLGALKPDEMTHPVDREVCSLLLARCGGS